MIYFEAECTAIDPHVKTITCSGVDPTQGKSGKATTKADGATAPTVVQGNSKPAQFIASSSRTVQDSARTRPPFVMHYDILVVAIGAENNTFNIPGVQQHAHVRPLLSISMRAQSYAACLHVKPYIITLPPCLPSSLLAPSLPPFL